MQVKKNPTADLNRDSGLYFVIGLAIVLFLVWRALEYKSYDEAEYNIVQTLEVSDLDEKVPVTELIRTPPPPPPPAAPEVIEIVEDTEEIEETIIESTEISQETVIRDAEVEASDLDIVEEEEEITVPFAVIENVPIFPGCENLDKAAQRACFNDKIQQHIKANFQYPKLAEELGIQGRVYVTFVIDTKGKVTEIQTRGPDKNLEAEAYRILATLPQMKPGNQRGRPVKVPYSIPVTFKLM